MITIDIRFVPLQSVEQALLVRLVRNQCCEFLTGFNQPISKEEQIRWFLENYQPQSILGDFRVWLVYTGETAIAYGALVRKNGQTLITECVSTNMRFRGIGSQLIQFLVKQSETDIWAEIWEDNIPSRRLHERSDFLLQGDKVKDGRRLLIYKLTK